jgi:hypothetical protein
LHSAKFPRPLLQYNLQLRHEQDAMFRRFPESADGDETHGADPTCSNLKLHKMDSLLVITQCHSGQVDLGLPDASYRVFWPVVDMIAAYF